MIEEYPKIDYQKIKNSLKKAGIVNKRIFNHDTKRYTSIGYYNIPCAFDTETTSTRVDGEKFAFCYFWQFGLGQDDNEQASYIVGRDLVTFVAMLNSMHDSGLIDNKKKRLICYIHNLPFEFQFFRKLFQWESVFATDNRKVIKALTTIGVEFRDSLILSGYKLETLAKNLSSHTVKKLVGNLDYVKVRNKLTKISKDELDYNINDVRILISYINEQIAEYKDITKIPLTNTGRVREYIKNQAMQDKKNVNLLMSEMHLNKRLYGYLKQAFAGGFTHANPEYVGQTLKDVASIDFTSSYPTVMLSEKYPMSKPAYKQNPDICYVLNSGLLSVTRVTFWNLIQKGSSPDGYLSKSKILHDDEKKKVIENNGRIYQANKASFILTNIDLETVLKCYDFSKVKILDGYFYKAGYLPKYMVKSILHFYQQKTTLKGVKGEEQNYMRFKQMLNSCYGMSVSDIIHTEYNYDDSLQAWLEPTKDKAQEQLDIYNDSKTRYLSYEWGVFVTAYARRNLWSGILSIGEDYVYSDTDSIKFLNLDKHKEYVECYNKGILNKLDKCLKFYHLNPELKAPKNTAGMSKPLGVWDFEGVYKLFKTLGAKRYLVLNQDNTLGVTVAGLPKSKGVEYLLTKSNNNTAESFKYFDNHMIIKDSGKLTATYIDKPKIFEVTDYQGNTCKEIALSSVHLEPATFEMSLSKQFIAFLYDIIHNKAFLTLESGV